MNEVSCKALWLWFEVARERHLDPSRYVEGLPLTVEHLQKSSNRIDWGDYCALVERLEQLLGGSAELERASQRFLLAPSVNLRSAAGLFTSPRTVYWAAHRWFGHMMFTVVESRFTDVGSNELELCLSIPPGFRDCPGFFHLNAGVLRANPRLLDLPDAKVEMTLEPRRATYRVHLPPSMTLAARLKRALTVLFSAGAAIKALGSQQDEIKQGYFQLRAASDSLEQKKHELEVISIVAAAAHASLDLEPALRAICVQVCSQLKYRFARFSVGAVQDGVEVAHVAEYGEHRDGDTEARVPLAFRGTTLGELTAARAGAITADERRFLAEIASACALAVHNAIAFQVIVGYRKELEARVSERTVQLTSALAQLKFQQAARQRIFQNISHELRTPLSLIGLSTQDVLLRDGEALTPKSRERLSQIDDSVQRLLHLFDGMLLLAAGQEGKLRVRPVQTDVGIVLRSLVSAFQLAARTCDIELTYRGPERLGARVDGPGLERAVSNLLSNAVKFTPQGGSIEVRLDQPEPHSLRVAVQDTGVGMDSEFLGRVFGRFEQGPAPVRSGERGSGIGLAIVKEIAEAHGGSATVESQRGRGSTFFVTLPTEPDPSRLVAKGEGAYIPPMQALNPGRAAEPVPSEAWPQGNTAVATVLVAEDDPGLRQFLVELLAREHRVVAAADGLSALRLAQEHQPALLISDVGMPGLDGLELTRRFRQTSGDKLAPVILLTAHAMVESRLQGLEAGAIDYVTKPFHPEELLSRVRGQLQLRAMALRLHEAQKLAGLGILSAGLAHELRNPANGVVNAVGPLKKLLPPELTRPGTSSAMLLDALSTSAEQIAVLTRQLLGFSRHGELDTRDEAVTRIVDSAAALVEPALEGRTLRRELGYDGQVRCARGLLVQVLVNLLENAAHASPSGSEIVIGTHADGGRLAFDVRDAGPGVPHELRPRIFDPFFTTKEPGKGTGLGLAISRMIAERHGGTLRLLESDRGGAFRLEVPLKRVALPKTSPLLDAQPHGAPS